MLRRAFTTSAEYHPLFIQNLKFLQDFWAHPASIDAEQEALVQTLVDTYPGIRLTEIADAHPTLSLDVVWALLATRRLFTDLTATSLMDHGQVRLYRHEAEANHAARPPVIISQPQSPSPPLIWDGRLFLVESVGDVITLRPEIGEMLTLPSERFQRLMQTGAMRTMTAADPSPTTPEIREAFLRASPRAQKTANGRLEQILIYAQGGKLTTPERTVQRWMGAYTAVEERYGCGYIGLLDHVADRGNRTPRISDASMQMLEQYLKEHYTTPQAKRAAAVYRLYCEECARKSLPPVSQRTFYRVRARFTTPDVTVARLGRRAAYPLQPFFWHLDQTTPRHGERPFALAHLDHTQLDILLVSSVTGKPLEKPWLTLLTDAYSRRILACYLTYDPPSYRSAMMVFRQCVQRYQRLPQELVVDRGADFGSVYFETLLARYFITKKERPAEMPHFGSVIERLFGTTTTIFLNQLLGNTQATKIPRQMTHEVDPRRLAVWTLERFSVRFAEWAYEVYDQMEHPALFQSPREAFTQGMQLAGPRTHRLLPYSEEFIMLTSPTTRTGRAKSIPRVALRSTGCATGIPLFRTQTLPEALFRCAMSPTIWGRCMRLFKANGSNASPTTTHRYMGALDEWREHQRQHGRKRITVNGTLVAHFLEENAAEEHILLQHQRDLEARSIREAVLGKKVAEEKQRERKAVIELDFTRIPKFEEYR